MFPEREAGLWDISRIGDRGERDFRVLKNRAEYFWPEPRDRGANRRISRSVHEKQKRWPGKTLAQQDGRSPKR